MPGLAVIVDYALILSAIVVLVLYVHHTAQSIRVGGMIGWVADATRDEVDRLYPAPPKPKDDPGVVAAPEYGVVTKLPHQVLVAMAEEADCVLELVPAMGDFVPRGGPLFRHLPQLLPFPGLGVASRCSTRRTPITKPAGPRYALTTLQRETRLRWRFAWSNKYGGPAAARRARFRPNTPADSTPRFPPCAPGLTHPRDPSGRPTLADTYDALLWDQLRGRSSCSPAASSSAPARFPVAVPAAAGAVARHASRGRAEMTHGAVTSTTARAHVPDAREPRGPPA